MIKPQVEKPESKHGRYATNVDVKAMQRKIVSRFVSDDILATNGIVSKLKPWLKNYLVCMAYCEEIPLGLEMLCELSKICDYSYHISAVHFNNEMLDLCFVIAELLRESKREAEYKAWVVETIPLICKQYIKYRGLDYYLYLLKNSDKAITPSILVGAADPLNEPGLRSTSICKETKFEETQFARGCLAPPLIDKQARAECIRAIRKLKAKIASGNNTGKELVEIEQINNYLSTPQHATLFKIDNAPYARYKMATNRLFTKIIPHIPYPRVIFERHYAYNMNRGGAMFDFKKKYHAKQHENIPEVWIAQDAIKAKAEEHLNIMEDTLGYPVEFLFAPRNECFITYAELEDELTAFRVFMVEMWKRGICKSGLDDAISSPSLPPIQDIIGKALIYYINYCEKEASSMYLNELVDYGTAIMKVEAYLKHYEKIMRKILEQMVSMGHETNTDIN